VLLCLGTAARASEDPPLPRSLADAVRFEPEPAPARPPANPLFTLDAYLGMLFMDLDFEATGMDLVNREVTGIGTGLLGVEALFEVVPDWRIGLAAEVGIWGDLQILSVGPVLTWNFAGSHRNRVTGVTEDEHYFKLALFYEKLEVTKTDFGDFDASFGVRVGYEMRLVLSEGWEVILGVALQYAQWDYSESVFSGDDKIGGLGGLISIGIGWLP